MLKGIDVNQRIEFVSKEDNSEPKTIFVFRVLSGVDMIGLSEYMIDGQFKLSGKNIVDFIDRNIVEIKNFDGMSDKRQILESLPAEILNEIISEITKINRLTRQDEKN